MSTPFPVQVGTNWKDSFYLKNKSTDAPLTGKVQGDFTIQVSRGTTGNLATTGITITEVDAANNPGVYDIVASGSTSFTATTAGKITVTVRLTSDNYYTFEQTILVTANGDFDGTSGAARFTATASDGRVTDGSNPLTGATVRLYDSANTIIAQLTTNSGGLWGPVFLDSTVTVNAHKSGYSVNNSNAITVVGSTATGPLQDVALTAVTSSSNILNGALTAYAKAQARDATGTKGDTAIQQVVNDAISWVATAKFWEFYKTYGDIALNGRYSTGTIAIASGATTCTLTTGTWPTWAASGKLSIAGKIYRIATRTSGSAIEVATAWQAAALTASTYVIFQDEYSLPSDCLKFGRPLPGQNWGWGGDASSFGDVLEAQNSFNYSQTYPGKWAVHGSGGTAKVIGWPHPSTDNLWAFWYYRKPAALANANDTADVDNLHLELLHRAIDYQVAIRFESCVAGDAEKCAARMFEAFKRAASNDKGPMNPSGPLNSYRSSVPADPRLG